MKEINCDRIHELAVELEAVAAAVTSFGLPDNIPCEKEIFGIWLFLTGISKELDDLINDGGCLEGKDKCPCSA